MEHWNASGMIDSLGGRPTPPPKPKQKDYLEVRHVVLLFMVLLVTTLAVFGI